MIHLSYEQEITLIKRLVMAQGVSESDAASLAAVVTHSDFTGTYSHGLSRLCIYLRQYMAGALVAQPDFRCVKDAEASLVFDCGGGSGIVAVNSVYDAVLERARKYGVAAGVGRNSANIGCGGYYGHRMADDNMIGIVVSNTYPCQSPFGGADRLIGTNPIIMGCPTTNPNRPIVIDISTSGVAIGKVQAYRRENKEMPLDWANDYDGNPTSDPHAAYCADRRRPCANYHSRWSVRKCCGTHVRPAVPAPWRKPQTGPAKGIQRRRIPHAVLPFVYSQSFLSLHGDPDIRNLVIAQRSLIGHVITFSIIRQPVMLAQIAVHLGKLRKSVGRCKQPLIHRCPNGAT